MCMCIFLKLKDIYYETSWATLQS